jgi:hypothetical protein
MKVWYLFNLGSTEKGPPLGKRERIVDRTEDMLIMGGFKVFSKRVEIDKKVLRKEGT